MKTQLFSKKVLYVLSIFCIFSSCKKEVASTREKISMPEVLSLRKEVKAVPFKGTYTTTVEVLSAPPLILQRISGVGEATHLGNSSFVALSTLNVSTPPPFQISGTTIFYAANGDEFYTSFTGTATPTVGGTGRIVTNTHTILGGTGRFENATGGFTGLSIVNLSSPTNTITYEGSINY